MSIPGALVPRVRRFYFMTPDNDFAEQRRRNQTAYAIEDFYDARDGLRYTVFGNILLAGALFLAWLVTSGNLLHAGFSLASGLALWLAPRFFQPARAIVPYTIMLVYVGGVLAEYAGAGLPTPLFPYLTVENGFVGFLPFANSLFPVIYIVLRLGLSYPIVNLIMQRNALAAHPMSMLRQLDRGLAATLE